MNGPELIQVINLLSRLPGLGPRSARRLTLYFLKKRSEVLRPLLTALQTMDQQIKTCQECYALDTTNPCEICSDVKRSSSILCVVADVCDVWALERSNTFKGKYHVLGGVLSAIDGVLPTHLNLDALIERVSAGVFEEVVLALNATIEGQTTMHYIADLLKTYGVKISTLAHGVPVGGELDYLDDGTLYTAFSGRRLLDAA